MLLGVDHQIVSLIPFDQRCNYTIGFCVTRAFCLVNVFFRGGKYYLSLFQKGQVWISIKAYGPLSPSHRAADLAILCFPSDDEVSICQVYLEK